MKKSLITNIPKAGSPYAVTAELILQIIMLIIKLILSGCKKEKAFEIASKKHGVPLAEVKWIWENHKK